MGSGFGEFPGVQMKCFCLGRACCSASTSATARPSSPPSTATSWWTPGGSPPTPGRTADELGLLLRGLLRRRRDHRRRRVLDRAGRAALRCAKLLAPVLPRVPASSSSRACKTGVPLHVDNPREVGADRVVTTLAAHALYGGPSVVVDFGTSTNVDAVSAEGRVPRRRARARRRDQPRGAGHPRGPAALGRADGAAPRSGRTPSRAPVGHVFGFAGQVDGIVARMIVELGAGQVVVATGGLAPLVVDSAARSPSGSRPDTSSGCGWRMSGTSERGRTAVSRAPAIPVSRREPAVTEQTCQPLIPSRNSPSSCGSAGPSSTGSGRGRRAVPGRVPADDDAGRGPRRVPRAGDGHHDRRAGRRDRAGDLHPEHRQALLRHAARGRRHRTAGHALPGPGGRGGAGGLEAPVDLGDHVGVAGEVITSRRGELSVLADPGR